MSKIRKLSHLKDLGKIINLHKEHGSLNLKYRSLEKKIIKRKCKSVNKKKIKKKLLKMYFTNNQLHEAD